MIQPNYRKRVRKKKYSQNFQSGEMQRNKQEVMIQCEKYYNRKKYSDLDVSLLVESDIQTNT